MPWLVGIDEAGYGPNLGPFVMSAVSLRVPESHAETDIWRLLSPAVRHSQDPDDERIVVGDSKAIYSTARGLGALENSVHAFLHGAWRTTVTTLHDYVSFVGNESASELANEIWYRGTTMLPTSISATACLRPAARLGEVSAEHGVEWGPVQSVVICSARFNQLVAHWGSKGAILGRALCDLIPPFIRLPPATDMTLFFVDKHGGRNAYAAMLQDALPNGIVWAQEERMERSRYTVVGSDRPLQFTFQPRADAEHFAVALASMLSKYLRELLMHEFNRFWRARVRNLKPTAGYPGDSRRFFEAIQPVVAQLGIPETSVWRER
jgi:ribonuclease HII